MIPRIHTTIVHLLIRSVWATPRLVLILSIALSAIADEVHAQQRVTAVSGRPFGVARFSLPLEDPASLELIDSNGFQIFERDGRVLYPAIAPGRFGEVVSQVLGSGPAPPPSQLNVSFLFEDDEPLEVTVLTPRPQQIVVMPAAPRRPKEFDRELNRWWKDYSGIARRQESQGDYPPIVETYLTSMLGGRLGLRPPVLDRLQESERSELQNLMGLLFGVEDLRFAVMRETMQGGGGLGQAASIPLPAPIQWRPVEIPQDVSPKGVEPIAMHVPEECFYLRFGSFENYLWFDRLKDDYGGNIGQMVTLRGHDAGLDAKTQQQLALKQSALAEVLGPQVISDVALIGRDLYLREGPAIGMLFEASNSALLETSLKNDRQSYLNEWKKDGATLETITIGDHEVSFLSTPDNRLRSFHVVDGDYHLVTTSRSIAERFLAAGDGQGALGAAAEFQHAREQMPLDREDTLFAYLSSAFFRELLSPQYQIELIRRLQSVTDMELIQVAELAAAAEGKPHGTVDDLVAGGFLPGGFGRRGDGRPPVETDHGYVDPLRGIRGSFIPIPDVAITSITPAESALYSRSSQFLQSSWPQMDPLMAGVKRYALEGERMERIVVDANVSPIAEEKYGWLLSMVGPPVDVQIQSDPSDVVTMQMSLQGGLLWPAIPAHQVFLGIQDLEPLLDPVPGGFLQTLHLLQTTPGYLGSWPQLGVLDLLPLLSPRPDAFGFSQLPLGLWRWQGREFSVLSFQQPVLAEAAKFLQPVPTQNPAQIQARISDLAHSRLAGWISHLNFSRSLQASVGNVKLLNTLQTQLRVSPPSALDVANDLLDTTLTCTLEGEYLFDDSSPDQGRWYSSAWPVGNLPPEEYVAPLLEWFRGATLHLTKTPEGMFLHGELDLQRKERDQQAVKLPFFDLFGGKAENGNADGQNTPAPGPERQD